ncbi:dGTP triphosphohydrolase [Pararhodonellum marinum]|uniref:dGTP triphosphohydrolase n=1 Tax=Pararhodonellum marinum TaxID=2755358 RepID=UPI00188F9EF1|nr:dNTP triphosphohydrolase [Pararhodonellum marinum]
MMKWDTLLGSEKLAPKQMEGKEMHSFRSEFEKDYDRIIFSAPFRNLQDKTQVFPLPEHDFVHTRLTHSLEVSSVGRSLGKTAGEHLIQKYPELLNQSLTASDFGAIVAAASLTHDIGNPPFGHAGEDAISDFFKFHPYGQVWQKHLTAAEWQDMCQFEGNAQGFRLLVAKNKGLKISSATLAAFTKYPRPSQIPHQDPKRRSQKKYGFFTDQRGTYADLSVQLGLQEVAQDCYLRHPLAFLVEAADDICYSIIDLEDGCTMGLVSLEETIELLSEILKDTLDPTKLQSYGTQAEKLAILRAMSINTLVNEVVEAFIQEEWAMLEGTFDQALTDIIPSAAALQKISTLSIQKIYRSKSVLEKEAAGFQVLEGLLEVFSKCLYHRFFDTKLFSGKDKSILRLLPENFPVKEEYIHGNPYMLLRELIDFISGMTDKYALSLYRRVKGIAFPGA